MSWSEVRSESRIAAQLAALLGLSVFAGSAWAQDGDGSVAERLDALEKENAELKRRIDLVAEDVQDIELGDVLTPIGERFSGLGPAASKVYWVDSGISFGGYGELVYQNFDSERDDGTRSGSSDEFDLRRLIMYFGYKFNDHWVFNSEIEYEHATTSDTDGDGSPEGEVSVEFAVIDYLHNDAFNARAGIVLLPMGFINELHEPTTFYSANRPLTERAIIPSTWRENGVGVFGSSGDFSYRSYVVNGLDATGFSSAGVRGGRQKGGKALAEDLAWVGRLDWTPQPGLLAGASYYVGNSGQNQVVAGGAVPSTGTNIYEAHAEWNYEGLRLRGLYAHADIDDAAQLNTALGLAGGSGVADEMDGWYLEAGYDVMSHLAPESNQSLIPFVRYEELDTQASVPGNVTVDPSRDQEALTFGLAWYPISQVVIKLDYTDIDNAARTGVDQWNVALGWIL